tara:strand:- start:130 stop:498 length:369 start_codon:yes stop_codon:yes gene_type:complete
MAEGFAKNYLQNYHIESGGTNPEKVNPYAIKVMNNIGIDISSHKSKKINDNDYDNFDLIVTLCGDAKDKCPIIGTDKHIHWGIEDPAKYKGNDKELIKKYSNIRDIIIDKIKLLKTELNNQK